jgi:hypothetical protein
MWFWIYPRLYIYRVIIFFFPGSVASLVTLSLPVGYICPPPPLTLHGANVSVKSPGE